VRLATRTALAAFAAASLSLLATGAIVRQQFTNVLLDRVDTQLERRAATAPLLVAVGQRLSESELQAAVEGTRILNADGSIIELGQLPNGELPPIVSPGFETATIVGNPWRFYTVEVAGVPGAGDKALVQLAAPLGDAERSAERLRRRSLVLGLLSAIAAGLVGYLIGSFATRPLSKLRHDAAALDHDDPRTWHMSSGYGAREVDEVAQALDGNLQRLAEETRRRSEALEAARAFAAGATHELRTPLQSALTNLDIAATEAAPDAMRHDSVLLARDQVRRMASSLTAVRRLADAEFADQRWFEQVSLGELADGVVTEELSRHPEARIDLRVAPGLTPVRAWRDGVELAVSNLVRNALVHGALDGADPQVVVTVENGSIAVDDAGPGIPAAERERVVQRFERNTSTADGSGLGLAISNQVAIAHGGRMHISTSPLGGARIVLDLAPI